MRWTIRNQIMWPLVAVAVVSLSAVGVINAVLAERRTCAQVELRLRQVVDVIATSSFPLTNTVLRQMRDLSSAEFVLTDDAGDVTATTLAANSALPAENPTTRIQDVRLGPSAEVASRWYFHTLVKLPLGTGEGRNGMLHVLFPQDEYRRTWWQAFVPAFIVGAATSLVLATVAWALASRMGRAIGRLRQEVMRIARGDFRGVPLPAIDDEIRDLSAAVNRTAEMLAEYEQQVRRSEQMRTLTVLGASLAHEMRNAATGCRMALDLHAAECRAGDDCDCLDVAKRQLQLMESQLQRFMRLGRRPTEMTLGDVNVGEVVESLLPLVRPAAKHAGVLLECHVADEPLIVRGDAEALGQVVLNILLNALEATQQTGVGRPAQSRVQIEVGRGAGDTAEIIVADSGGGPPERVANSLFEPFVTSKAEGAGLGLAVAQEVIAAHAGTIAWNRDNGMTQFRVAIPLALSYNLPRTNEQLTVATNQSRL